MTQDTPNRPVHKTSQGINEEEETRACSKCRKVQKVQNLFCLACASPLLEGRMVGEYKLSHLIGEGGMGLVYLGHHKKGQQVAIKFLKPHTSRREEINRRFLREARISAHLHHPSIVRTFATGMMDSFGPYLVMEFLEGISMEEHIKQHGAQHWKKVIPMALSACKAMQYAHDFGVIHRDLKPENIILHSASQTTSEEYLKIMDFGLAQSIRKDLVTQITQTGMLIGTPAYMAPEQFRAETFGPATDIYALGLILFELLTGKRPHPGTTIVELLSKRTFEHHPVLLSESHPAYQGTLLEKVIATCMHRMPQDRFSSMERLGHWLKEARLELLGQRKDVPQRDDDFPTIQEAKELPLTNLDTPQVTRFVGREKELELLQKNFKVRLCTIMGTGGLGKTRLAREFGHRQLSQFPGGVWFCDLTEARTLNGLCTAVAEGLNVPLGKSDPIEQLGDAILGRGRTLLIFDNFEQLVSLATQSISKWLKHAKEAVFLVTSRESLQLKEEHIFPLEPLSQEEALELFTARAQEVVPTFELNDHQKEVLAIVEKLDRITLAIELAAARVLRMTPSQILERLNHRFELLRDKRKGIPMRQATMRGALDWSWDLMKPWERLAWVQCSTFHGGFTLDAAEAVLDLSAFPEAPWPMDAVEALCDKSLLLQPEHDRFAMFETIREYAHEKLHVPGVILDLKGKSLTGSSQAQEVELRHARFFSVYGEESFLDSLHSFLGAGRQKVLEKEIHNLLSGFIAAEQFERWELAAKCLLAALPVYENRGPFLEGAQFSARLPQQSISVTTQGRLLLKQAILWHLSSERELAYQTTEQALALFQYHGPPKYEGRALLLLSQLTYLNKDNTSALDYAEKALELSLGVRESALEGAVLALMALITKASGQYNRSETLTKKAINIFHKLGDNERKALAMAHLATLYHNQGHPEQAKDHTKQALRIFSELEKPRREGLALGNLANIYTTEDQHQKAEPLFEAALRIWRSLGYRLPESINLGNMGISLLYRNKPESAEVHLREAVQILSDIRLHAVAENSFRGAYGRALHLLGQSENGRKEVQQSEDMLRKLNNPYELGVVICYRGLIELDDNQIESAKACLKEAQTLAQGLGVQPKSKLNKALTLLEEKLDNRTNY